MSYVDLTTARVPLLDKETGRFSDEYAPPSVVADKEAAQAAQIIAVTAAGEALVSEGAAKESERLAMEYAGDSQESSVASDGFRALSATAAGESSASQVATKALRDEAKAIRDSINADRGVANGLATLDASGRIPSSMLPLSALEYKGTWNASTNTPALSDVTGSLGDMYRVSTAGLRNLGSGNIDFQVTDNLIHNGTIWEKVDNTDQVSSVAGRQGAVVLTKSDVGLANVDNTSDANKPVSTATQTALNNTVSSGSVVGNDLVLTKVGGSQVNAGNVRGPQGLMGEQIPVVDLNNVSGVLDLSAYVLPRVFNITLVGAVTSIVLPAHQLYSFVHELNFKQDTTGGRTVTFPSALKFSRGVKPPLTASAGAIDQIYFESTGSDWLGKVGGFEFA